MKKTCGDSDIVITTAQVFGRRAPVLVFLGNVGCDEAPCSVIVDMAVETGGNVAGAELDKVVERKGVKIVGLGNLPARVPLHAGQVLQRTLWA